MLTITPEDRFYMVLINLGVVFINRFKRASAVKSRDYLTTAYKRDLGIGNDRRREYRMGFPTYRTSDTADDQHKGAILCFYFASVITVNIQTSRMTTGTGKLMELEAVDTGIIKILR